jgi:hypothetical protein
VSLPYLPDPYELHAILMRHCSAGKRSPSLPLRDAKRQVDGVNAWTRRAALLKILKHGAPLQQAPVNWHARALIVAYIGKQEAFTRMGWVQD